MINNINIRRVKANLKELFEDKIDMRDFPENQSKHFETRTLAAVALMMMAGIDVPQASIHITYQTKYIMYRESSNVCSIH